MSEGIELAEVKKEKDPFQDLVERDVRGKASEEEAKRLRSADFVDQWCDGLKILKMSLEDQISRRRVKALTGNAEVQDEIWRYKISTFKRHVEHKLSEAKQVRASIRVQPGGPDEVLALRKCKNLLQEYVDQWDNDEFNEDGWFERTKVVLLDLNRGAANGSSGN